jgi:hypothetical protein
MTYKQIAQMIESMGLPFTYDSFPNNIAPTPPYIVFNYPNRNDFAADNVNYSQIEILNLELYTATKDFSLEESIEAVLEQNGFFYEKSEAYIRNENLFQITYDMQFVKEN